MFLFFGRTDVRTDGRTDVRTPRVKIMTTYSAVAWWVKKVIGIDWEIVWKRQNSVNLFIFTVAIFPISNYNVTPRISKPFSFSIIFIFTTLYYLVYLSTWFKTWQKWSTRPGLLEICFTGFESGDVQTSCVKVMITVGRPCGLKIIQWISNRHLCACLW